jgi:hypothetical protein
VRTAQANLPVSPPGCLQLVAADVSQRKTLTPDMFAGVAQVRVVACFVARCGGSDWPWLASRPQAAPRKWLCVVPALACHCAETAATRQVVSCTAVKVVPKEGDTADRAKYYQVRLLCCDVC